jgi:hypothetical protein
VIKQAPSLGSVPRPDRQQAECSSSRPGEIAGLAKQQGGRRTVGCGQIDPRQELLSIHRGQFEKSQRGIWLTTRRRGQAKDAHPERFEHDFKPDRHLRANHMKPRRQLANLRGGQQRDLDGLHPSAQRAGCPGPKH